MRIVVVGGTGRIGAAVVGLLNAEGHEAVAASPSTGVDTIGGRGLDAALAGADVVVDVTNHGDFEAGAITKFFTTSTRNLLDAERAAGVAHHVVLSIVGADRVSTPGYLTAKVAQERLVAESGVAYTIVRATQFFEFLTTIGDASDRDGTVVLPAADLQPIAASDVAAIVADVAVAAPLDGVLDIAGPERGEFAHFVAPALAARGDRRPVRSDAEAAYLGMAIERDTLVPLGDARLGKTTFAAWSEAARS